MSKLKKSLFIISLVFLTAPLLPARAAALSPTESFLVKSKNLSSTEADLKSLGISEFQRIEGLNFYEIETTQENVNQLAEKDATEFIEKNKKVELSQVPNDPGFQLQTYLTNSNIVNAWDTTRGSTSTIVAVIDTGVDYHHEDLQNQMWTDKSGFFGYDFVNSDSDPMDDNGHGTEISGIIAAQSNNGIGIAGIANIKIMAVKAVPDTGEGDVADLARGIIYAADNGARVANVSLGLAEDSQVLDDAINYARSKNCLIVAATGNLSRPFIDNPARNPYAVGVGAVDQFDNMATYANYGDGVSLVALGNRIYSTSWDATNTLNAYVFGSGTSFSTPQVTGTAALLASKDPSLSGDQIKKRLIGSAKKLSTMGGLNYSTELGYGKLDAYNALNYDKYPPVINLNLSKNQNGSYAITGTVVDDKKSSDAFPDTPDSNIALVRYQVDGNGLWTNLNTNPVQLSSVNANTLVLPYGTHNVLVEATDTAGNKTSVNLNTQNASAIPVPPASTNISDYRYSFADQSSYVSLTAGQTANMSLALKNTGSTIWNKNTVHLGTSHLDDRASIFTNQTWLSSNRIAMQEDSVAVGDTAHFIFSVTAPNGVSGDFNEYFNLVADGVGWLNDMGIYWKISTGSALSYSAQYMSQSPYLTLNKGETANLWVVYKNTGTATWQVDSSLGNIIRLGTSNPLDRTSVFYNNSWLSENRVAMATRFGTDGGPLNVAPGGEGIFNFQIKAPNTPGTYTEYFRPVADGIQWLEDLGLFWKITVQ